MIVNALGEWMLKLAISITETKEAGGDVNKVLSSYTALAIQQSSKENSIFTGGMPILSEVICSEN